ncbi:MAG: FtsX-like permease family protein [Eubacterium sp.]
MLFKMSVKNIRRSFKDYTIYFFTLILGVAVFYVFNALGSQTVMLKLSNTMYEILELMNRILSGVSVFVSCILGALILYASRFLIKRRKKEFGIYLTLGMSKYKISRILFMETLLIGLLSLAVGLAAGVLVSQCMSVVVANLFDADMTRFRFVFSGAACIKTCGYFAIMYVLVMIFNSFNISRCRLVELIQADRKNERVKMKNPWVCTVVFLVAAALLGTAYWMVTAGVFDMNVTDHIYVPVVMGCIGTFLVFWSLSGLLLRIFTGIRRVYYRGVNSFVLRQFANKINTTVVSITVICLMLFMTISVFSGALSMKKSLSTNLENCAPVDVNLVKPAEGKSIQKVMEEGGFSLKKELADMAEYTIYQNDMEEKDFYGDSLQEVEKAYPHVGFGNKVRFMTIGDYNRIARLYGKDTYELKKDQYMVIADYKQMVLVRNIPLGRGQSLEINGKKYIPKYRECQEGFVELAAQQLNGGIVLVPDGAVTKDQSSVWGISGNYKAADREGKQEQEKRLNKVIKKEQKDAKDTKDWVSVNTRLDIAQSSVGLGALVTFVALYLGIIFLISSAAILALKELSESADNRQRYDMLRKIGVDEKDIHKALFKQIGIYFAFPLLLAVIHSIVGIRFIHILLETMGVSFMLASVGMTAVLLIVVYGGYFILTYLCSRSMIRPREN